MNKSFIPALAVAFLSPLYCAAAQNAPVAVDVSFIANGVSFGTHISDAILQKIGCKYTFRDPEIASKLLKLAGEARDMPQDAIDPKQTFEVRNKIVFHFQGADDLSVKFGQKYINQSYLDGSWNAEPVHLKNDLIEKVRETIRNAGGEQANKNASGSCEGV
ncbi:hypothetical protein GTP81_06485 [Rugamonas sp. FT107W]|uniref:Uncharacterized protein n=1 Tax=Duganella vulcania TaxID=2692166 RepID=A0A845HID1_9BURK|nr:hypothetical protein [Duganella vulcania]MYN16396.1 hypothetical protein [Duganella vulcania]